tara:strand:- start:673 stop:1095 length:423 start_codon:yes stop_codon:yes gene_type:complete
MIAAGLGAALLLGACQSQPKEPVNPTAQQTIYSGMLPCADCSGIRTTLTLYRDQYDNPTRFQLREEYMNGSKVATSATERGDWAMSTRMDGNTELEIYTINPGDPDADRQFLRDAVNAVELLDSNGEPIESNMNYRLLRK